MSRHIISALVLLAAFGCQEQMIENERMVPPPPGDAPGQEAVGLIMASGRAICSATLIDARHVLTLASCLDPIHGELRFHGGTGAPNFGSAVPIEQTTLIEGVVEGQQLAVVRLSLEVIYSWLPRTSPADVGGDPEMDAIGYAAAGQHTAKLRPSGAEEGRAVDFEAPCFEDMGGAIVTWRGNRAHLHAVHVGALGCSESRGIRVGAFQGVIDNILASAPRYEGGSTNNPHCSCPGGSSPGEPPSPVEPEPMEPAPMEPEPMEPEPMEPEPMEPEPMEPEPMEPEPMEPEPMEPEPMEPEPMEPMPGPTSASAFNACPGSGDRCWQTTGANARCATYTKSEDYSSGRFNVHRFAGTLHADVPVEFTFRRTAGDWAPALLLSKTDGTPLHDGRNGNESGSVIVTVEDDGRASGTARFSAVASSNTSIYLYLTAHSIIDAGFAASASLPSSARYSLTADPDCPRGTGTGTVLGTYYNTYYYKSLEENFSGPANTTLYDSSCNPLVQVSSSFSDAACIEGSARLEDGRIINYSTTCSCGRPCPTGGTVCWQVLDSERFPWGLGNRNNALVPLVSWAVDTSRIRNGTVLYVPDWDGVEIPSVDGLGGFTHDGCFRADDVGGAIRGNHFDFYAGTSAMHRALERIFPTNTNFEVRVGADRCAHLTE